MKKLIKIVSFSLLSVQLLWGQITTTITPPFNCVQNLVGPGVQFSNVQTFSSSLNSFATFTGGTASGLGFNSGIFLASGDISSYPAINQPPSTLLSNSNGAPGDATLNALGAGTTFNATVLQFDFVPTGDTIKFRYIFSSEEYNEYVNSGFNDVFAFFLTGPNPSGPAYVNKNIALIPSTIQPVTINNVNNGNAGGCASGPCNNCQYYVDNLCANNAFAFDGYTVALTAIAPVIACQMYTIKLAVADVGDQILDSGVFLEEGSFVSNVVQTSSNIDFGGVDTLMFEGCSQATIRIIRTPALTNDTIVMNYGGNATMGIDYNMLPDTLIFTPGNDTLYITVTTFTDNLPEFNEFLSITINAGICSNYVPINTINLYILDVDSITVDAGLDSAICAGTPLLLDMQSTGGTLLNLYSWTTPTGLVNDSTTIIPTQSGYYYAYAYDFCWQILVVDSILVEVFPSPNITTTPAVLCSGVFANIGDPSGSSTLNWTWTPSNNLDNPNIPNPQFIGLNPGPDPMQYMYYVEVDSAGHICAGDSVVVMLYPNPVPNVTPDSIEICYPQTALLNAGSGYVGYNWSDGATTATTNISMSGWYTATVTDANNCKGRDSAYVVIYPQLIFSLPDVNICSDASATIGFTNTNTNINIVWSPGDYLNNPLVSNPLFQQNNPGPGTLTYTYVISSDSSGFICFRDTMNVIVHPLPNLNLPIDSTYYCENDNVTLDAGPGFTAYLWTTAETTQTIVVNTTGWFSVTVTDTIQCASTDSIHVHEVLIPAFEIDDIILCEGDTIAIWQPGSMGNFLWNTGATDSLILVDQPGLYWVAITNVCGTGYDSLNVQLIPNITSMILPNTFSPNGDGINDTYHLTDIEFASEFTLSIYNRWGRLLFESSDPNLEWVGEGDGSSESSTGVYFVILRYINCQGQESTINGNISIFR